MPPDAPTMYRFRDDSTMTIRGSSNVRPWTMGVQTIDGTIAVRVSDHGIPAIDRIHVQIPVTAIASESGGQTRKAHDALQKERHPTISFRSDEVEVTSDAASGKEAFQVVARGELTVVGTRRTVDLHATGRHREDGIYRLRGDHDLRLSDFNVKRPTAMFGALRVSDAITLAFDVTIAPA